MHSMRKKLAILLLVVIMLNIWKPVSEVKAEINSMEQSVLNNFGVEYADEKKVVLKWETVEDAFKYVLCRSEKKNGVYEQIAELAESKKSYTDKSVQRGKTYYYKLFVKNENSMNNVIADSRVLKVTIDELCQPTIKLSRGTTSNGQKYVQIRLKKSEGKYAQIWMKDKKVFQRLKVKEKTIQSYKRKYRLSYKVGGKTLFFKVRTYRIENGKKVYSKYSKVMKIKI